MHVCRPVSTRVNKPYNDDPQHRASALITNEPSVQVGGHSTASHQRAGLLSNNHSACVATEAHLVGAQIRLAAAANLTSSCVTLASSPMRR